MYIQSNNYSVNMQGKSSPKSGKNFKNRIKQKILDMFSAKTINSNNDKINKWEKNNDLISHPALNRLILGGTGLVMQPTIDYFNHKVDKETREISRNRTTAKIIAGTTVGFAVRALSYGLIKAFTCETPKHKWSQILIPKKERININVQEVKKVRSAAANILAVFAMIFTNFLIDAPLTKYLTNKFNAKTEKSKMKDEVKHVEV